MRKRMICSNISYDLIVKTYVEKKIAGLKQLFGTDDSGKVRVTKDSRVIKSIADCLDKQDNNKENLAITAPKKKRATKKNGGNIRQ